MQNYKFEQYSLYKKIYAEQPFTFPSGERGPRGAVNEESTVCTARHTIHKTKLGYYKVFAS